MSQSKITIIYYCAECEAQYPKWLGQCRECRQWGTIQAETRTVTTSKAAAGVTALESIGFQELTSAEAQRVATGLGELDRVVGGGLVPGSLILLGGEPGIGKSTLLAQLVAQLAQSGSRCLYVSGEESGQQVKLRLERLTLPLIGLSFLAQTIVEQIISTTKAEKPFLVVIDSVQTIHSVDIPSEAGSVAQVRACTVKLLECAKETGTVVVLIGHVTKDGAVAGPRTLEHLVDVVLYLEGDPRSGYRLLRGVKNRFGSTQEVGVFEMTSSGLAEVKNPTEIFFSRQSSSTQSGTILSLAMEGVRPFLLELQALVTRTRFGYPKRAVSGLDLNRLQLLLAVLERRAGVNTSSSDVFVNVVGGYRWQEPAADLAIALAVASAFYNKPTPPHTVVYGEVGLTGEIRPVSQSDRRALEAKNLGFKVIDHSSFETVKDLLILLN